MTSAGFVKAWQIAGDYSFLNSDRHRVQRSNSMHTMLAQFYDLLGDEPCGCIVYDFQSQCVAHAFQRERHFADRLGIKRVT